MCRKLLFRDLRHKLFCVTIFRHPIVQTISLWRRIYWHISLCVRLFAARILQVKLYVVAKFCKSVFITFDIRETFGCNFISLKLFITRLSCAVRVVSKAQE